MDVDAAALRVAKDKLTSNGVVAHAITVDVSDRGAVLAVADQVQRDVGDVWLLVNNAGVFLAGSFLTMPISQWQFLIDVNLWGVVNCLHAFLPGMAERDAGHIVNTSSVDGILTAPNASAYVATKHAIAALTETLYRELDAAGTAIGVSLLCPGGVDTNIIESARHWPARLGQAPEVPPGAGVQNIEGLMSAADVATATFDAIRERRFWILTHRDQYAAAMLARTDGILQGANPDDSSVDPVWRSDTGRVPGVY